MKMVTDSLIILIPKEPMTTSQANSLISLAKLNRCSTLYQFEVMGLKLTSHYILHYLWSGDLSKSFS